jgi:hypothetical protein
MMLQFLRRGFLALILGMFFSWMLSFSVQAQTAYVNPLQFGDTGDLGQVLGSVLSAMQGIIVVLGIIFIIIGALIYITSGGNESRMTLGKTAITAALIGLALGIAAPSFLKEIAGVLGWGAIDAAIVAAPTLSSLALKVLNFLLSIIGVLAIIMLVIGGLIYLTAAGDENKAETGKKIVTYAVVGVSVALAALVITTQVASLFV